MMSDALRSYRFVEDLLAGHMASAALIVAHKLGLFELLARGPCKVADAVSALEVANRASFEKLLHTLVALELVALDGDGERYRNGAHAEAALVRGRTGYIGGFIDFFATQYRVKSPDAMLKLVKDGTEIVEGMNEAEVREYMSAMDDMAALSADLVAKSLPLASCRKLLDIAGGAGRYAMAFCRAYPELRVTLYELPPVLELARGNIAGSGLGDRIDLVPGSVDDFFFPEACDAAFLSQTIHLLSEGKTFHVMGTVRRCLKPGGLFVVRELFVDAKARRPVLGSLIGWNLWLKGMAYTMEQTERLLAKEGFVDIRRQEILAADGPAVVGSMVLANKKG